MGRAEARRLAYSAGLIVGTYDRAIATARRVIRAKGEACVWVQQGATPDASKPWLQTTAAPVETPTHILWLEANRQYQELLRAINGDSLATGQRKGLMYSIDGFEPAIGDTLRDSHGALKTISAVDPLSPDGNAIFYTVEFRK